MAPTSQKAGVRPISFLLSDGRTGALTSVNLNIRPEDLSRSEPSIMTPTKTFGGGWIDNWGRGFSSLVISGHTGWRGGFSGDGVSQFAALRDAVFVQWHALREQARAAGQDPDTVKLIYADALDSITATVAPINFTLKRNRSRPLLMMYNISMLVLDDSVQVPTAAPSINGDDLLSTGLDSLTDSLNKLQGYAQSAQNFIDSSIIQPVQSFLNTANTAMGKVIGLVQQGEGIVNSQAQQLIGFAGDLSLAGQNAFATYNAVADIPDFMSFEVSQVTSAFGNAYCVLRNAFKGGVSYPDYSGLYGSSNCSSTAGGSPLSQFGGVNTFEALVPQFSSPVSVSDDAQSNLSVLKNTDPVLAPLSLDDLATRMNSIANGVTFA